MILFRSDMSREILYSKLEEFLREPRGKKNVRIYSDSEHAEICQFLQDFEAGETPEAPQVDKDRLVDYGDAKKLVKNDLQREVEKKSDLFDRINAVQCASDSWTRRP